MKTCKTPVNPGPMPSDAMRQWLSEIGKTEDQKTTAINMVRESTETAFKTRNPLLLTRAKDVAKQTGLTISGAQSILTRLQQQGIVHCAFVRGQAKYWAYGEKVDG